MKMTSTRMTLRKVNKMYKWLSGLPFFGIIVTILNSYVSAGDFDSDKRCAPLSEWFRVLSPGILLSMVLALFTFAPACSFGWPIICKFQGFRSAPGALITSLLPNILGFGIGVYALIFALSSKFVKLFHAKAEMAKKSGSRISVLLLNAEMAFPLLVLVFSLVVGVIQQAYPEGEWLIGVGWFFLWYSLIETAGLIGVIFRLGEQALFDKVEE